MIFEVLGIKLMTDQSKEVKTISALDSIPYELRETHKLLEV